MLELIKAAIVLVLCALALCAKLGFIALIVFIIVKVLQVMGVL